MPNIRALAKTALEWKAANSENDGVIAVQDRSEQLRIIKILRPFGELLEELTKLNPPELEGIY